MGPWSTFVQNYRAMSEIYGIIGIWSEPFPDTTYYIPPNTWVFGFVFDLANSLGFFFNFIY